MKEQTALSLRRLSQQSGDLDFKGRGDLLEGAQSGAGLSIHDARQVAAVESSEVGKQVHAKLLPLRKLPNPHDYQVFDVHATSLFPLAILAAGW